VKQTILEISSLSKAYGALRPLRLERLVVHAGEQVAVVGPDQPAAEVFISLVTGASLPDTGEVSVFGRSTAAISTGDEWLASLERFGIVSDRAALLEALTVIQNLSVPFTLDVEPPPEPVRRQARLLAEELRLPEPALEARAGELDAAARLRLRMARALALDPVLLLLEHPSGSVGGRDAQVIGRDLRRVLARRGASSVTITADRNFARAIADRVLVLDPATGRLAVR
jgi:ABC-type transporter Mla maintaining outer membrane lipid asymmetry ATPase subunit MlaF